MDNYIAHKRHLSDGSFEEQALIDHLQHTAELSAKFASSFMAENYGRVAGQLHDIGKYSELWQKYIRGEVKDKIDHSSAGAQEACYIFGKKLTGIILAYCISGHHSGLLNGGTRYDLEGTLWGRLTKKVENYQSYHLEESCLNSLSALSWLHLVTEHENEIGNFSVSFFIRMLYSCLVDADFLDTEHFMSGGKTQRFYGDNIEFLRERFQKYIEDREYLNGKKGINVLRSGILKDCIQQGRSSDSSVFTLTVPTGGGKTIASLAFALENAFRNHRRHIVYVIPYCSIIEQTVDVFSSIVGKENILAAYSNADYDSDHLRLATENWDKPIVVTTAVQFFESFYSNRSSVCRKLHNLAESVIIFDEAQNLPEARLLPCLKVMKELIENYRSAIVLCTATQPALGRFFEQTFIDKKHSPIVPKEICFNTQELYEAFKRVTYSNIGTLSDKELAHRLSSYDQVLCIVSTRKQAKAIYQMIDSNNKYHLSTYMTPIHRRETLTEIRKRLEQGKPCVVVSTSLIEAGVDVDFPTVYRAAAGLDSEIQSGGRCNREGKRSLEDSHVFVFKPEEKYKLPPVMKRPAEITEMVTRDVHDMAALSVVQKYFENTYNVLDGENSRGLDIDQIVKQLESARGLSYPFKSVAEQFHIIDSETISLFVSDQEEGRKIEYKLENDSFLSREEYQYISQHSVSIYLNDAERIQPSIKMLDQKNAILKDQDLYNKETGLCCEDQKLGEGIFV